MAKPFRAPRGTHRGGGSLMRLRVVTLNVCNTEGEPERLAAINRELRRLGPDLSLSRTSSRQPM
ncbi:hypothetical protein X727_16330 [Mesorhizobium sp. L103C119B0]|nr:hypothetical protein X727_16330 [Mesorhizobium sp. L103C119B0]